MPKIVTLFALYGKKLMLYKLLRNLIDVSCKFQLFQHMCVSTLCAESTFIE